MAKKRGALVVKQSPERWKEIAIMAVAALSEIAKALHRIADRPAGESPSTGSSDG